MKCSPAGFESSGRRRKTSGAACSRRSPRSAGILAVERRRRWCVPPRDAILSGLKCFSWFGGLRMTSSAPADPPQDAFLCDCKKFMGSACEEEPFYKEHEGKRYCVLHYPGTDKSTDFKQALKRKLDREACNFQGVWFPEPVVFQSFSQRADFRQATFNAEANFTSASFNSTANFSGARFAGKSIFVGAKFREDANFSSTGFQGPVEFYNTCFSAQVF